MKKFLPTVVVVLSLVLFALVVYFTPPPRSWADASILQILSIFIPFLAFFTAFSFIFLRSISRAVTIGVGITILAALLTSNHLTLLSAALVVVLTAGGLFLYEKFHQRYYLTDEIKIPKLTKIGGKKK